MSAAEKVLARLDRIREVKLGDWYACCPAHDDKTPSLHITERENGIVLLHCFAGCSAQAVLDAVGLRWGDLYPDRWVAAREAAFAGSAPKIMSVRDDPVEHERLILELAAADLRAGRTLSLEDQAHVELARERLGLKMEGAA